jgi:hypothetical protein
MVAFEIGLYVAMLNSQSSIPNSSLATLQLAWMPCIYRSNHLLHVQDVAQQRLTLLLMVFRLKLLLITFKRGRKNVQIIYLF